MLALGPVVMMAGFFTWPVGDNEFGQAALDSLKAADDNMLYFSGILAATGVLMIFGGLFLLSQDLMANSGKMERDMLLMSRIGFMFAFTVFYLFFAMSLEANFLVKEGDDHMTVEENDALALDLAPSISPCSIAFLALSQAPPGARAVEAGEKTVNLGKF